MMPSANTNARTTRATPNSVGAFILFLLDEAYSDLLLVTIGCSGGAVNVRGWPTAKYFIGGGAVQWSSLSNKDFKIDKGTTLLDDEALWCDLLTPFKVAVDASTYSVMVRLNSYGDTKLSAERALISAVLKGKPGLGTLSLSWPCTIDQVPVALDGTTADGSSLLFPRNFGLR